LLSIGRRNELIIRMYYVKILPLIVVTFKENLGFLGAGIDRTEEKTWWSAIYALFQGISILRVGEDREIPPTLTHAPTHTSSNIQRFSLKTLV
jgi:hypothetical protein